MEPIAGTYGLASALDENTVPYSDEKMPRPPSMAHPADVPPIVILSTFDFNIDWIAVPVHDSKSRD